MSARTPPSHQVDSIRRRPVNSTVSTRWTATPTSLRWALGVAAAGGLLSAIGPALSVTDPAASPGFGSVPLLFVMGLLPVAVATIGLVGGRPVSAGGVLVATALFAPGRAIADAQLAVDGSVASRPELAMPTSLMPLHGSTGLWLILAGHALTLVAGLLAIGQAGLADQAARAVGPPPPGAHQGPVVVVLLAGVAAAIGLVVMPFTSDDPYLLARGVLDSPPWAMVGGLFMAVAAPLAATIAVTTVDVASTRGWLLGCASVVVAIATPRLVAGSVTPNLHPSWGPVLALVAAAGLIALAVFARHARPVESGPRSDDLGQAGELRLPGRDRLHAAAGALGLLAGACTLIATFTDLFVVPAELPHPPSAAGRLLVPAAILVGVLSATMLVPRWAPTVRPTFVVALAAVPLTGASAVDAALTAAQIDGITLGLGTPAIGVAMLLALAAACCGGLAGGVEREDVDLTAVSPRSEVMVPALAAALLAFGAFGLPVLRADGYTIAGLWSDFRVASWGLLTGLVVVLVATALAPLSRPPRACASLLGAAGVVVVRLLELPLTHAVVPEVAAGPGEWLALACVVALIAGAITARRSRGRGFVGTWASR